MTTEIKIWQISENHVKEVEDRSVDANFLESELENWIVERPDILGEDLLIIAKQKSIANVGRLDLLALAADGTLVVVELKRSMGPREAVAQALDYASWLNLTSENDIRGIAEAYLQRALDGAFAEQFGCSLPAVIPEKHRILLVCSGLDAASERIINYLAEHSLGINAVFFRYAKLDSGVEILARSVLIPESMIQETLVREPKTKAADLMKLGTDRQVSQMIEMLRSLAKDEEYVWEEAGGTYGGSFRFWRKNLEGKGKMIIGVNVSGERLKTPAGQLDIWIPTDSLAQVLGVSEQNMTEMLKTLPIFGMKGGDVIVRLENQKATESVAQGLKEWFGKYPGFYGNAPPATTSDTN